MTTKVNAIARVSSLVFFLLLACVQFSFASGGDQHGHDHDHSGHDHDHAAHATAGSDNAHTEEHAHESVFNASKTAFHHISDQNIFNIGPITIPLPAFLYAPGKGWSIFSSGKFAPGHHGIGHNAIDGYVLYEGMVRRVVGDFPSGEVHLADHALEAKDIEKGGKSMEMVYLKHGGKTYETLPKSTLDAGFLGGGITNFYDFSLTKNVVTMIIVGLLLAWLFISIAKSYTRRKGQAPAGVQAFLEPIVEFIRDEVAIPFLGEKSWERYTPFLLSIFFFILALNLFGQVPFFGGPNVTGNLAFTAVLAILTFIVTNFSGKKDYWQHIFWMPGVPVFVKPILALIEILGVFIKPFTLMLRLAANITAGHLVIVIFVGLIYIFSTSVESFNPGYGVGAAVSIPLTIFMMAIELLVAFIQAFVFTILTASYIGAAIEEHHH